MRRNKAIRGRRSRRSSDVAAPRPAAGCPAMNTTHSVQPTNDHERFDAPSARLYSPSARWYAPSARLYSPTARLYSPTARLYSPSARLYTPSARLLEPVACERTPLGGPAARSFSPRLR